MDSKDNKEDKTREEADMTPSPVIPNSSIVVQKCPGVVQIHISKVFYHYPYFGSLDCFEHYWKNGLRVMSASSLVLSSLLSLPSTVHLPATVYQNVTQKGWGQSAKLGTHSAICSKLGTALQAYALNPCTKFPPNPTSRKVNT